MTGFKACRLKLLDGSGQKGRHWFQINVYRDTGSWRARDDNDNDNEKNADNMKMTMAMVMKKTMSMAMTIISPVSQRLVF